MFLAAATILTACPGTNTEPVTIERVNVTDGSLSGRQFELTVVGRGFGLQGLTYNVGTGQSTTHGEPLELELIVGPTPRQVLADSLTIESTRLLRGRFTLLSALEPGVYGVSLWSDGQLVATLEEAFQISSQSDGGMTRTEDANVSSDAGVDANTTAPDTALFPDDAEVRLDADPADAGFTDSGLGPFLGTAPRRRPIVHHPDAIWPAGATLVVPVDHLSLVRNGRSRADARDFRVYQGSTELQFQFADRLGLETTDLRLVIKLAQDIPAGGDPNAPLVLYYGNLVETDSHATDLTFVFAERFSTLLEPFDLSETEDSWYEAEDWLLCQFDRPGQVALVDGSYCVGDRFGETNWRQTLSTPRLADVRDSANRPPGTRYEMQFWLAGRMTDGDADILYLSHFTNNRSFSSTRLFERTGFSGRALEELTFTDNDGSRRPVFGWRMPSDFPFWWDRVNLVFTPDFDRPSLHFRYVSTAPDGTFDSTFVAIDDWWIRLALDPDPVLSLGQEEVR